MAPFCAVVATSMQPKNVDPNNHIKLCGLTDDGWQKLLTGSGVNQAAIDELAKDKSLHWYLTDPYTLRLLAPVLARRTLTTSDNVHKLMGDAVDHRLQGLPHSPAMNSQSLRATATATIRFLQASQGFAPDIPGEISEGIAHIAEATGSSLREIDNNLTALAKCGIVKRTRSLENAEYVTFSPAIGAYFYTCVLLENPDTISVRMLLHSRPFRLTAISLLKVCDSKIIERFILHAERLLDWAIDGLPAESTSPDDRPDENQIVQMAYYPYAALSVLVEGLQNRLEVLDERLREKTIEFTERAMPHEAPDTQADLLELSYALGTREQAISTMKFGLDSPDSTVLFDTASRMVLDFRGLGGQV
jgi:hypothetical protein